MKINNKFAEGGDITKLVIKNNKKKLKYFFLNNSRQQVLKKVMSVKNVFVPFSKKC